MHSNYKVATIIPAYNEEQAISQTVQGLLALRCENNQQIIDLVIVSDNGSSDKTADIAEAAGARVVREHRRGYGYACLKGLNAISYHDADIVLFVDGDCSVKVSEAPLLLNAIINGADLAIGQRIPEKRHPSALTPQQIIGNKLASGLIRLFWHVPVSDLGPFRAIGYHQLIALNMQDPHFGWTTEMQIRAIQQNLNIIEIPVSSLMRIGKSKISGTVLGTLGAAYGIIGTIIKLRYQQLIGIK